MDREEEVQVAVVVASTVEKMDTSLASAQVHFLNHFQIAIMLLETFF